MLASIGCYPVFFLAILVLSKKALGNSSEKIADVIKNITRVNNVLQDLIKNYEHLEKIYKSSKEIAETDYSGLYTTGPYAAVNRTGNDMTRIMSASDENTENGISRKPKRKHKNRTVIALHRSSLATIVDVNEVSKQKTPQILFVGSFDGSKKIVATTTKKKRFHIKLGHVNFNKIGNRDSVSRPHGNTLNSTREFATIQISLQSTTLKNALRDRKGSETTVSPNALFIKMKGKIVRPTSGTMYVLGGNVKNKTIGQEIKSYNNHRARSDSNLTIKRMEFLMASDNEMDKETASVLSIELPAHSDNAMVKDIFKTHILRKAYGDACLKLVVRKCYMACKNTIISVCKPSKCKKGVKKVFNKIYKDKCDELFNDMMLRANAANENTQTYIAAVCEPMDNFLLSNSTSDKQQKFTSGTSKYDKNLVVLRAKYEKACVKTSRDKCNDACTYSYTNACKEKKCNDKRLKTFRRTCIRQCKIAFVLHLTKDKISSSSSSSSSSSETDKL